LICAYCRAANDDENHRCSRCGRRLGDDAPARRPDLFPVQHSAAAPAIEPAALPVNAPSPAGPQLVTELPKVSERRDSVVQASLFGPEEVVKTVPPPPRRQAPATPRPKRDRASQQALDFNAAQSDGSRTLPTSIEAAVFCNAPVAIATHRAAAGALDTAIVLIAIGVFLGTIHVAGHEIVLSKQMTPIYAAVAVLIALFYRVLFCIAEADTFGTHWSGLRLLNFDGRRPTRRQRLCRTAATCVSVISLGIGFAWAICDEERLSWHDYMSKTFPSPRLSD
jgi:uncharacterized RDD family membrane protein YckC